MSYKGSKHKIKYECSICCTADVIQGQIGIYIDDVYTHRIVIYNSMDSINFVYDFNGKLHYTKDSFTKNLKKNGIILKPLKISYLILYDNLETVPELFWQWFTNQDIFFLGKSLKIEYD